MSAEHAEHAHHPYYKVLAWLTAFTIGEVVWAFQLVDERFLLIAGLAAMVAIKAALVGLYYMHLKYEGKLIWAVIVFPLVLVVVLASGFLPDALWPYGG